MGAFCALATQCVLRISSVSLLAQMLYEVRGNEVQVYVLRLSGPIEPLFQLSPCDGPSLTCPPEKNMHLDQWSLMCGPLMESGGLR